MPTSPVVEFRSSSGGHPVLTSLAFTGTGFGGAIPVGTTSSTQTIRIYNNFAAAGSIADATGCVLAAYDDVIHQGTAVTIPSTGLYVQVEVIDYNGSPTNGDIAWFPIGGQTKHAIPTNSGTISGSGANYVTVTIQIVIPAGTTQGAVSQGLWLEYNSTA
jgi:hypothetical protein